ncbi:MAG: hypothetical protein VYE68_01645 [Acidobacteriota bacterium]|nr:hypothetical protein [Acidobacteriota bacterium]
MRALTLGTTLGPYKVIAKLDEGGRGEAYRAREITPDRNVALKVCRKAFTAGPDWPARFE